MNNRLGFKVLAALGVALAVSVPVVAQVQNVFETPQVLSAAALLPPQLLKGSDYQVENKVENDGTMNNYVITSSFGTFEAHSNAEAVKRIGEVGAIAKLKKLEGSDEFGKGIASTAGNVVEGTKALITDPVNTIGGIFRGAGTLLRRTGDSVFGDPKSKYEDNALQSVAGVSQAKREFAAQMGVDVYSSNEVLQESLLRVARASASGNILAAGALAAVGGGAGTFVSVTGGSQTLNDVLLKTPPVDLRRLNREKLQKMGVSTDLIDLLLANVNYSPTYQVLLVDALERMGPVAGKEAMLKIAISADTDDLCMFRQRQARMFAGYHAKVQPLERLMLSGNLVLARARDGKIIVTLPVDYVVWTDAIAQRVVNAEAQLKTMAPGAAREVWLGGTISPRARQELESRGWKINERAADNLIGPG